MQPTDFDNVLRLRGARSCRWVEMDDVRILFQAPAAKTHFINPTSAFILDLLAEAPAGFQALCQAVSGASGVELSKSQVEELARHVQRLDELGLITSSPADAE
jgi:PqqD family protein of HPr-rel-A system